MVRTSRPLVERMTLVFHDWFATSNAGVGSQKLMLAQNRLLRRYALGSFDHLLVAITANPAMLLWLSGTENRKDAPNENYGRELMELFTLGEGNGYTEKDVREQARALTGWASTWKRGKGQTDFRFDPKRHDTGTKVIFGKKGTFAWRDAVALCLQNPRHAPFFVEKLWSYFVPEPPDAATRAGLEALYRDGFEVRPVLDAILRHPALYTGPRMVKSPVVYTAGLLRGAQSRDRHERVGLALRGRRPAALLSAQRRRLGRLAVARHQRLPRALVHRERGAREGVARRQEEEGAEGSERPRGDRRREHLPSSATRRSARRHARSCSPLPAAR